MAQDLFKINYRPLIILAVIFFTIPSCNNNNDAVSTNTSEAERDTINYTDNTRPGNGDAVSKYISPDDAEKAERQKLILMQIDSTYAAITLLDDAKEEMTEISSADLSTAERNKKSKAIFNINIIQNELTRALDASILANLKLRTKELAGITTELEKNVSHLQSVTEKLNKATQCIGRLTNILALGLSKGIIKPFTPKESSATAVKAAATTN